ncbi:MAG: hypothetical protein HFE66_01260 [Clostridiales bacterium]|nr:hypothetical protein [Clostridiales bacterium]
MMISSAIINLHSAALRRRKLFMKISCADVVGRKWGTPHFQADLGCEIG